MPKAKSQAQAGLFGIIAGGGKPSQHRKMKMSSRKAKDKLRGVKVGKLPKRVASKGKKK